VAGGSASTEGLGGELACVDGGKSGWAARLPRSRFLRVARRERGAGGWSMQRGGGLSLGVGAGYFLGDRCGLMVHFGK
jgi:hypothetical protein